MSHLIQPIEIEGTKYCVNQNGNRTTRGVATEIVLPTTVVADVTAAGGPWLVTLDTFYDNAEISFAVGCGSQVTVNYLATSVDIENNDVIIEAYIDGSGDGGTVVGGANPDDVTVNYDITNRLCGTIISLAIYRNDFSGEDPIQLMVQITGVS